MKTLDKQAKASRVVTYLKHTYVPTDTGITIRWVLSAPVKGKEIVIEADDFISDEQLPYKDGAIVDSYDRVRNVVLMITNAMAEA